MPATESKLDKLRKLFPGRDVPLGDTGVAVRVMPLKLGRLAECENAIREVATAIGDIARAVMASGKSDEQQMAEIIAALPALITGKLLSLIESDVPLEELPHHLLPPVIAAWVEDSFGGGKLQGWTATISKMMALIPAATTATT